MAVQKVKHRGIMSFRIPLGSPDFVPHLQSSSRYRDSKLTQLLRNCLGGNARTVASWNENWRFFIHGMVGMLNFVTAAFLISHILSWLFCDVVVWHCEFLLRDEMDLFLWWSRKKNVPRFEIYLFFFHTVDSDTIMLFSSWQSDVPGSLCATFPWIVRGICLHGPHTPAAGLLTSWKISLNLADCRSW